MNFAVSDFERAGQALVFGVDRSSPYEGFLKPGLGGVSFCTLTAVQSIGPLFLFNAATIRSSNEIDLSAAFSPDVAG